jgi:putative flippase GtrA
MDDKRKYGPAFKHGGQYGLIGGVACAVAFVVLLAVLKAVHVSPLIGAVITVACLLLIVVIVLTVSFVRTDRIKQRRRQKKGDE